MAWLCVDKDGTEVVFSKKPVRATGYWKFPTLGYNHYVCLPKGSIKKLIGKELNWRNKPVELKEEL